MNPGEPGCGEGECFEITVKGPQVSASHGASPADVYSRLHPTWVATQALRDRNFDLERRGNAMWEQYMKGCLRKSNLAELASPLKLVYEGQRKKRRPSKQRRTAR